MAAPLLGCTKEEQRSVVDFLWEEVVEGVDIHTCLCVPHGVYAVSWRSVHERVEMLKQGQTSVTDAECFGCP
ncbi:hypothetical protein Cfor_08774 [Coptotermes formosanus]|jgi:hypothetical protein|uniref:Uncharacterized protein n=1 Tax=Coptotermes formosanus TaxID=36987 RepID=A0A6L2Q732_COPFO|nr:hypothetical protein Cfor_08774 [Coptotermes formosanus]